MAGSIVKLLRLASFAICAIVVLSFGAFALEQTRSASSHQQEQIAGHPSGGPARPGGASGTPSGDARARATPHMSTIHRVLDEASEGLTSPFASVLAGSGSEWATRGAKLILALALYGFGLGYLARVLRVRV